MTTVHYRGNCQTLEKCPIVSITLMEFTAGNRSKPLYRHCHLFSDESRSGRVNDLKQKVDFLESIDMRKPFSFSRQSAPTVLHRN